MAVKKKPYNEFGLEVTVFCARHGITKKSLAKLAGVPYVPMIEVMVGRHEGRITQEKVNAAMKKMERAKKLG